MTYEILGFLMIPMLFLIDLYLYNKINDTTDRYLGSWKEDLQKLMQ